MLHALYDGRSLPDFEAIGYVVTASAMRKNLREALAVVRRFCGKRSRFGCRLNRQEMSPGELQAMPNECRSRTVE